MEVHMAVHKVIDWYKRLVPGAGNKSVIYAGILCLFGIFIEEGVDMVFVILTALYMKQWAEQV